MNRIRTFLALSLPDDVRSGLAVQQFLLPLPRKVPPEDFHLTLVFLGEEPERQVESLHERLEGLRHPGFDLTLDALGMFGGAKPRAVYAGVARSEPLAHLQAKLEQAARMEGFDLPHRRFVPHVTLGRFSSPPEDADRLGRLVATTPYRASFSVTELGLYLSHLTEDGPRYELLASYPLT